MIPHLLPSPVAMFWLGGVNCPKLSFWLARQHLYPRTLTRATNNLLHSSKHYFFNISIYISNKWSHTTGHRFLHFSCIRMLQVVGSKWGTEKTLIKGISQADCPFTCFPFLVAHVYTVEVNVHLEVLLLAAVNAHKCCQLELGILKIKM